MSLKDSRNVKAPGFRDENVVRMSNIHLYSRKIALWVLVFSRTLHNASLTVCHAAIFLSLMNQATLTNSCSSQACQVSQRVWRRKAKSTWGGCFQIHANLALSNTESVLIGPLWTSGSTNTITQWKVASEELWECSKSDLTLQNDSTTQRNTYKHHQQLSPKEKILNQLKQLSRVNNHILNQTLIITIKHYCCPGNTTFINNLQDPLLFTNIFQ